MTKLLDEAVEAVRRMPPADQDAIAGAMLDMARVDPDGVLHADELRDALEGLAQVDRGEAVGAEEIEAAFRRFRP